MPSGAILPTSEQHCEAFLPEVVVMREDVAHAPLAHCMHRDTVHQAITFVRACFVKRDTRHECFMALWSHFDIRVCQKSRCRRQRVTGFPGIYIGIPRDEAGVTVGTVLRALRLMSEFQHASRTLLTRSERRLN